MNELYETETFSELYDACDNREKRWIDDIKKKLKQNLKVGKPLRFDWFREKKLGNKRLFYIINEKTKKTVLLAFGTKKDQQKIINHIIINKELYLKYVD
ncbi:hypothetical protein JXB41_07030 [Candidatus Woesearchaeota archaeon]|nr:hypothetical protein [Candidatus Woesearchaeota archaeon]